MPYCIAVVLIARMLSRRRRLRRTSSRHRRQQPVASATPVASGNGVPQVVDLTFDIYNYDEQFVDLTDLDGSPVIIPDTPATRRPPATNVDNLLTPYVVSDGSMSDDDLPPVPFKITAKPRTTRSADSGQGNGSSEGASSSAHCPVCLDSFSEVKAAGRQVMATTCGHVFCEECIQGVLGDIVTARKCPTCRKKLTARSVHPLFI